MADFSALKTAIQANIRTNGNEEITGAILQDILLSMVSTMGDGAINALAEALQAEITNRQNAISGEATTRAEADSQLSGRINAEAQTRGEADTQLGNSITAITTRLNEGYVYAGIATPSTNPGTPAGKVFYIALQAGTYTNFSSLAVTQGITILKYNGTAWSQEQLVGIDDVPTAGSNNLVKSGGVFANIGAFDISEYNKSGSILATYADLTAALAALPSDFQKGGMSIKFVQSSDNKYVQFRYMGTSTAVADFTNVANWQGVDDEPTAGSENLVKSGGITEVYGLLTSQTVATVQSQNYYNNFVNVKIKQGQKVNIKATGDASVLSPGGFLRIYIDSTSGTDLGYLHVNGAKLSFNAPNDITTLVCYRYGSQVVGVGSVTIELFVESDVVNAHLVDIKKRITDVDTEPTTGSTKFIESGALASVYGVYTDNPNWMYYVKDASGKFIYGVDKTGKFVKAKEDVNIPTKLFIDSILKERVESVYARNKDKEDNIYAACRFNQTGLMKDFQIAIVTDTHTDNVCISHTIEAANKFATIDGLIHLGDFERWAPNDTAYSIPNEIADIAKNMLKPWLIVCGNHDVGPTRYLYYTRTHEQVYNDMVKPMIDNGILKSGEYQTSGNYQNKCYYFHDFNAQKVRLIVIYEYDWPLELEDSNENWEYVAYDESYEKMLPGTTYTYDESNPVILNCGEYKGHSFKLRQTVTTLSNPSTDRLGHTMPGYKMRSCKYISLEQINWLANVLSTTPNGYGVVIATHIPAIHNAIVTENRFSIGGARYTDRAHPANEGQVAPDDLADKAILEDIINAWLNKTTLVEKVAYHNTSYCTQGGFDGEYVNTLNDGENDYAYQFNLDFSQRTNNNCYFGGYLSGHEHYDIVERSSVYSNQFGIVPCCGNPEFRGRNDTANVNDTASVAYDNIDVFSCQKDAIKMARIGNIKTIDDRHRDFEVINTNV